MTTLIQKKGSLVHKAPTKWDLERIYVCKEKKLPLYRPPTQSQNAKTLLGSMPNSSTSCIRN